MNDNETMKLEPYVEPAQAYWQTILEALCFHGHFSLSKPIEGLQPIDGPTGVIYCLPYPKYEA